MGIVNTERSINFDVFRVLCTLWIVGVWHLFDYFPTRPHMALGGGMTIIALSSFAFISGFFLQKYIFNTCSNILAFFKKRFLRFYVLYALSIATLCIGSMFTEKSWFVSNTQIIFSLAGLNAFIQPAPGTIWFMGIMMFLYLVTPIIRFGKYGIAKAIIIYLCLYAYSVLTGNMDERLLLLYPMYVMGLYTSPALLKYIYTNKYINIVCLITLVILCLLPDSGWILAQIITSVCGIILLLKLSTWLSSVIASRFVAFLSYTSLCLYLFHRQVFELFRLVLGKMGFEVGPIIGYAIMLPTAILVCYCIQWLYDKVLQIAIDKK